MSVNSPFYATAGSLFDKQSDRIQEVLNKNIEMFLPALDPAWRDEEGPWLALFNNARRWVDGG